jgi:hypothetical protein
MPVFSKPVQPTSTVDIPRSSRKRTLNPKLTTEDNVHPQANAIKRRKIQDDAGASTSQSNKNKNSVKPPAKKSRGMSQAKSYGQKGYIEDDEDSDIIMNDKDSDEEENEEELEVDDDEEEKDDNELQEDNDKLQEGNESEGNESEDDVGSQEELDQKELGMLHPPFGIHLLNHQFTSRRT